MKNYDVIVVGGGPGGYSLAAILAKNGKKVALFEQEFLGGTCVNRGCIPTKTILKSAKIKDYFDNSEKFGLNSSSNFNLEQIFQRAKNNSLKLQGAISQTLESSGVDIYKKKAKIVSKNTLIAENEQFSFEKLVIATGAKPRKIEIEGTDNINLLTSDDFFKSNVEFDELTIIGGGVISLEFAAFYASFGKKITIIEAGNRIFGNFDDSIAQAANFVLTKNNVKSFTNSKVLKYENNELLIESNGEIFRHPTKNILLAIGRQAVNDSFSDLNLDLDSRGFLKTNEFMQTSVPNIYAIGDITGQMMLSTVAYKHGDIVAKHILTSKSDEKFKTELIPWAIYTNPEIAAVGKTEKKLISEKIDFQKVRIEAKNLPRAHANGEIDAGFIELFFEKGSFQILGANIFLEEASLLINQIALALLQKMTIFDLQKSAYTHPTLNESIYYICRNITFSNLK
ncbi:Thioredoxin reductase [Mesomycoplasma dispar]|uniref:Thioredoxin reductase n=1 Tax=Mesomycoplasma dispar TaxID=86660 RepID=A0AAJ5NQX4_9BACT|nr:dihydrolipoyl dehydrogenase [Mesomycoplasma dispar]AJR12346.1 dihydrolipoamide dehydrogenase [Mesomycoplasma dispar]VEU62194.1 Thioredoxin reductase [Mesomycoplasma dispar]